MSTIILLVILSLFALSAFWSGTETALTSLSTSRVKKLIAMHPKWLLALKYWLEKPYYILSVILIGNTFTNMTLGGLATYLSVRSFGFLLPRPVIEFMSWLVVTFLLLIFGEITPKVYCRRNSERISVVALPAYEFLIKALSPVFRLSEFVIKKFSPRENMIPFGRLAQFSVDEIRQLFAETNLDAMLGADASTIVYRILKIGDIDVAKIMTPVEKIEGVCLDCNDENLLDKFIETSRSRIPVVKSSPYRVTGYVHIKDILKCLAAGDDKFDETMVRVPYIVPRDKKVGRLLKEFQSGNSHIAFVADEDGAILGLVTLEDILEELVGEILDEYDIRSAAAPSAPPA